MYEIAKKARAGMKSKAERLAGEKDRKTDSSDWSPAPQLNADVKTGMRPVSRQARKSGGKVMGEAPAARADRKPRKAGGRVETKGEQPLVDRYVNRDLKKANEYRDGKKHDGGLKRGGRAAKADGGSMSMEEMIKKNPAPAKKPLGLDKIPVPTPRPANLTPAANNKIKPDQSKYLTGDDITGPPAIRKDGGRAKKADGGSLRQRFNAEFAKQRASGAKKFTFEGKEYTTELAKPNKSPMGSGPGSSRAGAPPMGAGPGSRSANVAAPAGSGPGSVAPKPTYTPPRVMGTGQGVSTTATPSVTTGSKPDERRYEDAAPVNYGASLGNKNGGRIKKADGGPMMQDPRLGIVKPKAMEFGQNVVVPGLKKGGRIKKFGGGALGMSANRMMPQLPPQAMANAQGVPMQGGSFMPPGLANRPAMPTLPPQAMAAAAPTPMPMPMARASGGRTKAKGKTNINIVIATGAKPKSMIPDVNQAPMGPQAVPMVAPPAAAPMGAGAPPSAPMGGGQPPMPPMPMPRKAGGRVSKVAHSFKDMTAGSGSGEGRLQKTDIAKSRSPRKAGGKVYRSYKDMDAGAGSGEGRLEKTEIQSRKR